MARTILLRYAGPPGQSNPAVAAASGKSALLEPGDTYRLGVDLADQLQQSTPYWSVVHGDRDAPGKPKRSAKPAATPTPPEEHRA